MGGSERPGGPVEEEEEDEAEEEEEEEIGRPAEGLVWPKHPIFVSLFLFCSKVYLRVYMNAGWRHSEHKLFKVCLPRHVF